MATEKINIILAVFDEIESKWLESCLYACGLNLSIKTTNKISAFDEQLESMKGSDLLLISGLMFKRFMAEAEQTYIRHQAPFPILVVEDEAKRIEYSKYPSWTVDTITKNLITLPLLNHDIRSVLREYDKTCALEKLAHYDILTGAANRFLFNDRLEQALVRVKRYKEPVVLMYLDLDKFKAINDNYGHAVGDEVLIIFTAKIGLCLRVSDTIGRLGGDEFVVLLLPADKGIAGKIANKIFSELNKPVEIDGHELLIRASIGVVCKTGLESEDSLTVGTILQDADKAVYQAKKSGRNQYVISS